MGRLADDIPAFDQLFNPLLEVLRQLGGSASNSELEDKVSSLVGLTGEQQNREH